MPTISKYEKSGGNDPLELPATMEKGEKPDPQTDVIEMELPRWMVTQIYGAVYADSWMSEHGKRDRERILSLLSYYLEQEDEQP